MPYPDYKVGEPLCEGSDLCIVDAFEDGKPKGSDALPISRGGTGVVYRAVQGDLIERAVKVLNPAKALLEKQEWEAFSNSFEKEKRQLAQLTHSHLAKLISFGTLESPEIRTIARTKTPVPFLVMEYIAGRQLHEFMMEDLAALDPAEGSETVVDLLSDVLSAMQFLHANDAMHSDIKEANILVRHSSRPEAVVVDLGAAHVFADSRGEFTTYITTKDRVTEEWKERILERVPVSELQSKRQYLDLLCFGSMLTLFLNRELPTTNRKFDWCPKVLTQLKRALGGGIVTLYRVADKCLAGSYATAGEAAAELNSMREGYVSPLGVPELSLGTNAKTSLALPTDSLPLTERITSVLNHPCLQRLRRLPQLDFVSLIAIGATHTRLLHSLETYRLGRLYVGNLLGDPVFRAYCGEKSKLEAVLLASLSHDIGHFPLEHVFEDFAFRREATGSFSSILRDEDMTLAILGAPVQNADFVEDLLKEYISTCRNTTRSSRLVPLTELISNEFGPAVLGYLRQILGGEDPHDEGIEILRSVVSGPLDIDKVAYLQTDSYFSGVRYGKSVDVDSLLSSLTCTVGHDGRGALAIREKGICAAEAIATSRRWMFQRVYWHKTNRAIMAMLRYAPQRLLRDGLLSFEEYIRSVYPLSDVEAVKWLDQLFQLHYGAEGLYNPAQMVLDGRRSIYKEFLEFSGNSSLDGNERVRRFLMDRSCAEWLDVAEKLTAKVRKFVPDIAEGDILLDIPSSQRHDIGDVVVVDYNQRPPSVATLSRVSDQFRSTREFFDHGALSCRVFIHPEIRRMLAEKEMLKKAQMEVADLLVAQAPR